MKIGVAALLIHPKRQGGPETYARRLLEGLQRVDRRNQYVVFVASGSDFKPEADNFRVQFVPAPVANPYLRVAWDHTFFSRYLMQHDLDLTHFLGSILPRNYRRNSVVTIHDTLRFQVPKASPYLLARYYDWNHDFIRQRETPVISVSHADCAVMAENCQISTDRMYVTHLGVDERFLQLKEADNEKSGIVWIGKNYVHKNVRTLIEAYALLNKRRKAPRLRLIGLSDAEVNQVRKWCLESEIPDEQVSLEGPVQHDDVPGILRSAELLCFPSIYESFGLPVIEAIASGTAVVCSSLPCFRELFGEHVEYCEPTSAQQYADAMERLLVDKDFRKMREKAGLHHAAKFTWDACAKKTVEVYEAIGERSTSNE